LTLLAVLGSAALVCACSVVVGQAVWRLAGFDDWTPLAGAIGLATLIAATLAAVQLPGAGVTAAVAALVLVLAAAAIVARLPPGETAVIAVLGLAVASLPFIATGRVGILGVTDNADFAGHLMLADAVAHGHNPVGLDPAWYSNYPTGPHALAGALSRGLGFRLDAAFTGMLLSALALSALAAAALLRDTGRPARVVGGLIGGISYLAASYTVQSSFKETLLGLFVLAWLLALVQVARAAPERPRAVLPLGLLAAGAFADYSFVSLAWLGAAAVAAGGVALIRLGRVPSPRGLPRRWLVAPAVFVVLLLVGALPQLNKVRALHGAVVQTATGHTTGGNIRAELPAYEVFGVWPSSDLRDWGAGTTLLRALALLAGCVVLWAGWWWWRRGRAELPAAGVALLAIYAAARLLSTPYYSAKALAIASFVIGAMTVGAVVSAMRRTQLLGAAAGVVFLALAAWSTGLALRGARVAPPAHASELAQLAPLLRGQPTLYMAQNDYLPWLLHSVPVAFPYAYIGNSQVAFNVRPEKPWAVNEAFDFDNLPADQLDHFRFALQPRTLFASRPPRNWHLVRTTRSYLVWRRAGPTPPRAVLAEPGMPGAPMDCSRPPASQLATQAGVAGVRPAPVIIGPRQLRLTSGKRAPIWQFRFARLAAERDAVARASLPRGRFDVSLQYVSPVPLDVWTGHTRLTLPASLEGPSAFWSAGTAATPGGTVALRIHPHAAPVLATFRTVLVGSLTLTPAPVRERGMPLQRACGRYVDWYRTG
jgi:hypothetical protein